MLDLFWSQWILALCNVQVMKLGIKIGIRPALILTILLDCDGCYVILYKLFMHKRVPFELEPTSPYFAVI